MSIQIDSANRIKIDGQDTGLALAQRRDGTVIYTPEGCGGYREHRMPYGRYSTAHDAPSKPGEPYDPEKCAGRALLEQHVRALLTSLSS